MTLSIDAATLLEELQCGENVAEADIYPSSLAFSSHAELFISNAAAMAEPDGMDDYRIFGVLYLLRHGMELWLKCFVKNAVIDEFLSQIFSSQGGFNEIAEAVGQKETKQKEPLRRALCVFRNVLEDRTVYPECWKVRMEERWAEKAVEFMRTNRKLPRERFASLCQIRMPSHGLKDLWLKAEAHIIELHPHVLSYSGIVDVPLPESPARIRAMCELLDHYDPEGDAFRYPVSLAGKWHTGLPHFSLEALGKAAKLLAGTVCSFTAARTEAYESTTLSSPWPSISDVW